MNANRQRNKQKKTLYIQNNKIKPVMEQIFKYKNSLKKMI